MPAKVDMEKIVSLCKRRGFIFPSSEIYGGLASCWDYGPMGVELKRNVKEAWWKAMVQDRDDVVGLDTSIMMHPGVWAASGHIDSFTDPLVECKSCHLRWRADTVEGGKCPKCDGELTEPRMFNLMFKTFMGPVEEEASIVYLRPETAQGIFVNFENVVTTSRKKLPMGIAQIGKSFRNEITPGNFIFRTREFEHMEVEYFVKPGTDERWLDYWVKERFDWYVKMGIKKENLRLREHGKDELAHYAKDCYDVEYLFPMGWPTGATSTSRSMPNVAAGSSATTMLRPEKDMFLMLSSLRPASTARFWLSSLMPMRKRKSRRRREQSCIFTRLWLLSRWLFCP